VILIVDFGSQYNQLIARRVREQQVYCQIEPPQISLAEMKALAPEGIILSGSPASIYEKGSPRVDPAIFDLGVPVLGICYGMQYMVNALGGKVKRAQKREYGFAGLRTKEATGMFYGIEQETKCWMSHGDMVGRLPKGFRVTASTANTRVAATENSRKRFYGLQFHPEVVHTPKGKRMLNNFLFRICGCKKTWTMRSFIRESIRDIRATVGDNKVILGLSGGVDSSVTALLRQDEAPQVKKLFKKHLKMNLRFVNARRPFLRGLKGVVDPEKKRKIIGRTFIEAFEKEAGKLKGAVFLGQGTLYPDIIESRSAFGGPSAVIKSHHNVGGLPRKMKLKLIEPLRHLFKDEVRVLGKELELPEDLVWRQPFPGPGLAIRIISDVTQARLAILRKVDMILLEEITSKGLYKKLWQSFAVLLPLKSVGIMGDQRTYEHVVAIRAVTSTDAMTADWARLPHSFLGRISNRIINEVRGVNRVVYDISSKPPSTIEWE
jgi:GMP synthase (glutamine-hydrolysing)